MIFSDSKKEPELDDNTSSKLSQQFLNQEIQGFDYAVLTSEVQLFVQSKTSELKSLMRRSVQDIIHIGQKLTEVKEQLGHGNFRAWLKAEFDWSVRTATRFMQVANQFKCANLAHLNITLSALYLLAEPSTPEKARAKALELAKEGENITNTKAKAIVNLYREQTQPNAFKPATIDISAKATEGNSLTPSEPRQSPPTHAHAESKDKANPAAIEPTVKTVPTLEWDNRSEHKAVEKIDWVPKEYSEVAAESKLKLSNRVRVLNIEHQKPDLVTNTVQTFALTFTGVRVDFEGFPEALIILFEQMQNNPAFTEEVLRQAKLLAVGGAEFGNELRKVN